MEEKIYNIRKSIKATDLPLFLEASIATGLSFEEAKKFIRWLWEDKEAIVGIVEKEGVSIGCGVITIEDHPYLGKYAYGIMMYVKKDYREKGIGKFLVEEAVKELEKMNINRMFLVFFNGKVAAKFWESLKKNKIFNLKNKGTIFELEIEKE